MKSGKKGIHLLLKTKNAQGGVFGLSFGMIFSIIMIIFFVIVAFIALRAFLSYQKCATIGFFFEDLQSNINEAWNSQSTSFRFNYTLPAGIQYVCFVNLSSPTINASNIEAEIYEYIKNSEYETGKNFFIYAPDKKFCSGVRWNTVKHVDISKRNPICAQVSSKGRVSIKIERKFESALVSVSA